ncbi:prepilin-type N-terminal cleavage/methylation domain-containing protein [Bowmanella sp. JS7-9]|uniref:Prepilin-type N-terminal cleavage/methylation domain-containing protein n=1 Tax=Pseudobowmanella zhangzhouensis TaxID=1537679 RepID=A0ABW1XIQ4_9ALTE|nr:prepilin-type N-terminal cleavage/methylation domain-containing protein [Bowmanella sp. JS7-9]
MKKQAGFTLIEMLIAALVILIGVTGYVTLQSNFMRSDAQLNLRAVALKLAQEKMDDLRTFTQLQTTAGVFDYNDVQNNAGGALVSGNIDVAVNADADMNHTFIRNWTVTNQYYVDTNADGLADTWLNEGDPGLPANLPSWPSKKVVTVQISWQDYQGDAKQVQIDGTIAPVVLTASHQALQESDNSRKGPTVDYTPGVAPDVISYDLGDGKKVETSKPVPEVNKTGDNIQVQFETVKYIELPDDVTKLEQEDFLTVNCKCALAGQNQGYTPSQTTLVDGQLVVQRGQLVTKTTGVPDGNGQPELCTACCRDHHDTAAMVSDENYYRKEWGNPHRHYNYDGITYTAATLIGDKYIEACRFKRVDGLFELYADWYLVDVITFKQDYLFNEANFTAYRAYTEGLVESRIAGSTAPTRPANRDFQVPPGAYQMIARGIYVDRITDEHRAAIIEKINAGDATWKAITPFYDVNLTLLSGWDTGDAVVATITEEPIETIVDPDNDLYGTYSRGRLEALADGTTNVSVKAYPFSSGITGTNPISPFEVYLGRLDDTVNVEVNGKATTEKYFGLIGDIKCVTVISGVSSACETNNDKKADYVDLTALALTADPAHFSCSVSVPKGKATPFYSCDDVSENWNGTISLAFTAPGYSVTLKVEYPDGSQVEANAFSLLSKLEATSNRDYNIIIELTP